MEKFLYLEGAYLILSAIILLVTLFVVTRPFMGRFAKRYGLLLVTFVLGLGIIAHYIVTINRMQEVKKAFENGKEVICESRLLTKAAQSIIIRKKEGWRIEDDFFKSPNFERDFFLARCIIYK